MSIYKHNKWISPHLVKLHNTTFLSKDIIKTIQMYLLPDRNYDKIKKNKKECNKQISYLNKEKLHIELLRRTHNMQPALEIFDGKYLEYRSWKFNNRTFWCLWVKLIL
jgi:hypothetical protein